MRRLSGLLVAMTGALAACVNADDSSSATAPPLPSPRYVMRADGPRDIEGIAGAVRPDFPRIRLVESVSGRGIAGVKVTFRRVSTGELKDVITDDQGVARFGDFSFGPKSGTETITASSESFNAVSFTGYTRGTVIEQFDLTQVGGNPLPIWYADGGAGWTLVGGHFVLLEDSTYYYYRERNAPVDTLPSRPAGRYERKGNTIAFFATLPANRLFAIGTLLGSAMFVEYDDFLDFDLETFQRR